MEKSKYTKPQIYRVKLEPEQAVLTCCSHNAGRTKFTSTVNCGGEISQSCGGIGTSQGTQSS